MSNGLRDELKLTRSFQSIEQEAFLNLQRTAWMLLHEASAVLKPFGLSSTQYNVLRILRGAGAEGLPCKEVAGRMVTQVPDVTRLLDRLEQRGLIERSRCSADRRVVTTQITDKGQIILTDLDAPMLELHVRQLEHLDRDQLKAFVRLLEAARTREANPDPDEGRTGADQGGNA
jgi:DNA-binding MarR family transcriptional regulator